MPFVGLELVLEFLHQLLHALIGVVFLFSLEDQLLESTLSLTEVFHLLCVALLLLVQLILQLLDLVAIKREESICDLVVWCLYWCLTCSYL